MNKILIVDDEPLARQRILQGLVPLLQVKTDREWMCLEAANGLEALNKIRSEEPKLLFLDIDMPQMTGLEVLQNLEEIAFEVIFQTAHDDFAIKAFELNACDYLLKPFSDARLAVAFERALIRLDAKASPSPSREPATLQNLNQYLLDQKKYLENLVIKVGAKSKLLSIDDALYFVSENHVSFIQVTGLRYSIDVSLSYLEKNLDPSRFLRVHRNVIVSKGQIDSLKSGP